MENIINKLNNMWIYIEDINKSKIEDQEEAVAKIISNASVIRNSWNE